MKIKAKTLSEANKKLYKQIPSGFFLVGLEECEPIKLRIPFYLAPHSGFIRHLIPERSDACFKIT